MRFRDIVQTCAATAALALAAPALAQGQPGADHATQPGTAPAGPDTRPEWKGGDQPAPQGVPPHAMASRDGHEWRDQWLADCRRRISVRDDGVGGAVIGGIVGGVAGNRIAGRGNRTVGTIAGAAVGAAAGMAIEKAEDNGRVRDECEAYLDSYYDHYARVGGGYGYGYGHGAHGGYGCCQGPMMMVPIYKAPRQEPECVETVEYVYEDVPVRAPARRIIPRKRVKIVPDKRVKIQ